MLLLFIIAVGCNGNGAGEQDLVKMNWIPMGGGEGLAYVITDTSDDPFIKGDTIMLQLAEVRKQSDNSVVDSNAVSPIGLRSVRLSVLDVLTQGNTGFINKHSEGYIKLDLSKVMAAYKPYAQIFLKNDVAQYHVDSLLSHIAKTPGIDSAALISKELSLERWKAAGNSDPVKELGENPFFVTIDLIIGDHFFHADSLENLKATLMKQYPAIILSISYSKKFVENYGAFKNYFYIFRYKT
jgi:hypothetical protein